jgi:membrane associated rhomboid family serine protease
MGIYDREYYRREGPSLLGSLTGRAQVCKWLIIINIAAFILQLLTANHGNGGLFTDAFELDVQKVVESGQVWRLLTYAFLHLPSDIWHIVINMLFLWWFGNDLEEVYGSREFLAFYLVSAVVGGLAYTAQGWIGHVYWHNPYGRCLGASGAVMAVMILCACHFPGKTVLVFFILPMPIWLMAVIWVALDAFRLLGNRAGEIAVTVHLGGAAFGFAYFKMQWRLTSLWSSLGNWQRRRNRPKLRVYRPETEEEAPMPTPVSVAAPGSDLDEHLEAKLDAVLEKVAKTGQASLTDGERQILMRASEVYKRRRS